jgi:adenosylcobinamide-GDP ribazoletransferase
MTSRPPRPGRPGRMYPAPMFLRSILALLQFTTVLPLGEPADFDAFARRSYLYPVAGWVIGGIAAALVVLVPVQSVAAALAVAAVLLLSGCNHFDGLLDFGDGLMAHGSREKRVTALTDRQVGSGGVAAGIAVTLLAAAGLVAVPSIPVAIVCAEVCAKAAMGILTTIGTPFHEGIHSYLYDRARPWFPAAVLLLCLPLILLPIAPAALAAAGIATITLLLLIRQTALSLFGGVNGDVVGATGEIVRAVVICVLAVAL